jgi:DNA-binding NtrC family response regulator
MISVVAEPSPLPWLTLAHEEVVKYGMPLDDNLFLHRELLSQPGTIVGGNSGLRNVMEMVQQVAPFQYRILMGNRHGKEIIANAIHFASPRKNGPLSRLICGAIPDSLIDSELFGHEKGASPERSPRSVGASRAANGGPFSGRNRRFASPGTSSTLARASAA